MSLKCVQTSASGSFNNAVCQSPYLIYIIFIICVGAIINSCISIDHKIAQILITKINL